MFHKYDRKIITFLLIIFEHMKKEYDFPVVITGVPGTGKSHFGLQLLDTWYRVILRKKVTASNVSQVNQIYRKFIKTFKNIEEYDMNIFDEGSTSLGSTDFMTKVSKDMNKLADVFRCKRFFWVIVLPNYFRLNKALREDRIRAVIWIDKRAHYKIISKYGLKYLNGFNDRRKIKSMNVAYPILQYHWPEYKGPMLKPYQDQKMEGVDDVYESILNNIETENMPKNLSELLYPKMKKLYVKGEDGKFPTVRAMAKQLEVSNDTIHRMKTRIQLEKAHESAAQEG